MSNVKALYVGMATGQVKIAGWITLLVLVGLGIASRLPFQSTILHHWDSVNFALALEHFDVRLHQPHPPGTFVFYILLGRLLNLFFHEANASLVWVSILATGLAAAAIFRLGMTWFDRRTGAVILLVMLTSPLVWFHGEVALSYMLEFFWVLLIVLACFQVPSGDKRALFLSALLLGLAGGIRPNTPFFLFPLWFISVALGYWRRTYSSQNLIVALALGAVGVALWAIPLVIMSGGPLAYWETIVWWRGQHLEDSGSAEGILVNSSRLVMFTLYSVGVGLLPIAWALFRDWRALKNNLWQDWRTQVIALWLVPALAYFFFIHIRQAGHTFTIIPGFMVIAGLATVRVGRYLERWTPHAWLIVTSLVVGGNTLFFLCGPANLFGSSRLIFSAPTWATIQTYDTFVQDRLAVIRREFPPQETIVLAGSRNFRLPDFYLPEYQETFLSYRLGEKVIILPDHVRTLVLFDETTLPQLSTEARVQLISLPDGGSLRYITWDSNQEVALSQSSLAIKVK